MKKRGTFGATALLLWCGIVAVSGANQTYSTVWDALVGEKLTGYLALISLSGQEAQIRAITDTVMVFAPSNQAVSRIFGITSSNLTGSYDLVTLLRFGINYTIATNVTQDIFLSVPTLAREGTLPGTCNTRLTIRTLTGSQFWVGGIVNSSSIGDSSRSIQAGQSIIHVIDVFLGAPCTIFNVNMTVYETIANNPELSIFYQLASGDTILRQFFQLRDRAVPVFVPNDAAFRDLLSSNNLTLEGLVGTDAARRLLFSHVLRDMPPMLVSKIGPQQISSLATFSEEPLDTLSLNVAQSGKEYTMQLQGAGNTAPVTAVKTDIAAGKAVMHILNGVLLPQGFLASVNSATNTTSQTTITYPSPASSPASASSTSSTPGSTIGIAVGASAGGVLLIAAVAGFLWRKRSRQSGPDDLKATVHDMSTTTTSKRTLDSPRPATLDTLQNPELPQVAVVLTQQRTDKTATMPAAATDKTLTVPPQSLDYAPPLSPLPAGPSGVNPLTVETTGTTGSASHAARRATTSTLSQNATSTATSQVTVATTAEPWTGPAPPSSSRSRRTMSTAASLSEKEVLQMAQQILLSRMVIPWESLKVGKSIGAGGFGTVFKAEYQGNIVAVKMLQQMSLNRKARDALKREAQAMFERPHPCIANIYGIVDDEEHCAIVMRFYRNGSLREAFSRADLYASLTLCQRLTTALQVANGLACLHERSMIHGDLKSANLLVQDDGHSLVISDFGLSCPAGQAVHRGAHTVAISPPEVLADPLALRTMAGDVYAYGIVLLEIVTGRPVYKNMYREMVVKAVLSGARPAIPDNTPTQVAQLIERCWAQEVADRPTMAQVVTDLQAAMTACGCDRALDVTGSQPGLWPYSTTTTSN